MVNVFNNKKNIGYTNYLNDLKNIYKPPILTDRDRMSLDNRLNTKLLAKNIKELPKESFDQYASISKGLK